MTFYLSYLSMLIKYSLNTFQKIYVIKDSNVPDEFS